MMRVPMGQRLTCRLTLSVALALAMVAGCSIERPRPTQLHILIDSSASVPQLAQDAMRAKAVEAADAWCKTATVGSRLTVWTFTTKPAFPVETVFTVEIRTSDLPPPVYQSRRRMRERVTADLASRMHDVGFTAQYSPIVEGVSHIANTATGEVNLAIVSDLLQTSLPSAKPGLVLTPAYVQSHPQAQLQKSLAQMLAIPPSCALRTVTLCTTYGMVDKSAGVDPRTHQSAVNAFEGVFSSLGATVTNEPVAIESRHAEAESTQPAAAPALAVQKRTGGRR